MKEEITIYVVTDIDGVILRMTESNSLLALCGLVMELSEARVIGGDDSAKLIHLITVYSTDGIMGKHYQDVDLFHRRLRECRVTTGVKEEENGLYCTSHDCEFSTTDYHKALSFLVTLGEE